MNRSIFPLILIALTIAATTPQINHAAHGDAIKQRVHHKLRGFEERLHVLQAQQLSLTTSKNDTPDMLRALLESLADYITSPAFSAGSRDVQRAQGTQFIAHLQKFCVHNNCSALEPDLLQKIEIALATIRSLPFSEALQPAITDLLRTLYKRPKASDGTSASTTVPAPQGVRIINFAQGQFSTELDVTSRDGHTMFITGRSACTFIAYEMALRAMAFFQHHSPLQTPAHEIRDDVIAPALIQGITNYAQAIDRAGIQDGIHTDADYLPAGGRRDDFVVYNHHAPEEDRYDKLEGALKAIPRNNAMVLIRPPETYCILRVEYNKEDYYIYIDSHAQSELTHNGTFMLIARTADILLRELKKYRQEKVFTEDDPVLYIEAGHNTLDIITMSQATPAQIEDAPHVFVKTPDGELVRPANPHLMATTVTYAFPR